MHAVAVTGPRGPHDAPGIHTHGLWGHVAEGSASGNGCWIRTLLERHLHDSLVELYN